MPDGLLMNSEAILASYVDRSLVRFVTFVSGFATSMDAIRFESYTSNSECETAMAPAKHGTLLLPALACRFKADPFSQTKRNDGTNMPSGKDNKQWRRFWKRSCWCVSAYHGR